MQTLTLTALCRLRSVMFAGVLVFGLVLATTGGARADDPLCLNDLGGQTPNLDGLVPTDAGWTQASQYVFGNGTPSPDAVMQMVKSNGKLYFSFQVNHDDHYHPEDKVILLLAPDPSDATKDWRIHIHPVSTSGNAGGAPTIRVWKNSTTWASRAASPDPTPSWIAAYAVAVDGPADQSFPAKTLDNSYVVELAIDGATSATAADGIYAPGGASLRMHVNVLRVYTALLPSGATQDRIAGQLNWPSTAFLPGAPSNPTTATLFDNPARANWGTVTVNVSLTAACNGVAVTKVWLNTESNQSVLQPPASGATSTTNNYYVRLKNTGTGAAPGGILAKINSYRFGISGGPAFGPVPASPNPLGPSSAVPSGGGTADLGPAVWTLSASDYQSTYASNSLVCSFVLLDVDPAFTGRTLVANRYFYWNTHYGTASKFRHVAYLDTRGFAAPNDRSGMQHFDLRVFPKQVPVIGDRSDPRRDANLADRIRAAATEDELQQLGATALFKEGQKFYRQTVCGYRSTGRYVQMGGGDMELMENTPCFSYWLRHKGEVTRWTATLAGGDGVKQLSPTKLSASLQQGTAIALTTDIEAEEPRGTSWPGRTCSMLSASSSMVLLAGIVGIGAGTAGILHRRRRRRDDA